VAPQPEAAGLARPEALDHLPRRGVAGHERSGELGVAEGGVRPLLPGLAAVEREVVEVPVLREAAGDQHPAEGRRPGHLRVTARRGSGLRLRALPHPVVPLPGVGPGAFADGTAEEHEGLAHGVPRDRRRGEHPIRAARRARCRARAGGVDAGDAALRVDDDESIGCGRAPSPEREGLIGPPVPHAAGVPLRAREQHPGGSRQRRSVGPQRACGEGRHVGRERRNRGRIVHPVISPRPRRRCAIPGVPRVVSARRRAAPCPSCSAACPSRRRCPRRAARPPVRPRWARSPAPARAARSAPGASR